MKRRTLGNIVRGVDAILASKLSATEKLVLLALHRRRSPKAPECEATAAQLGRAAGLHRVTVQNTLSSLREAGVLSQLAPKRWTIEWDAVAFAHDLGDLEELFGIEIEHQQQPPREHRTPKAKPLAPH